MKYLVVTGGVVSGLGKGISISSMGVLLRASGLRVTAIKIDPYLNSDAGTMSPFEHGEVFVLNDGGEADLDLGNYERFLDVQLTRDHNLTTGKVYSQVINAERRGDYLGKTVQVIPHVTDAIQDWLDRVSHQVVDAHCFSPSAADELGPPDVCLIEVGGTVGDIESLVFLEALRQFQFRVGPENFCLVHVSLVPVLGSVGEQKTKPTQHTVKELRSVGLNPDIILCRSASPLSQGTREKLALFCQVPPAHVITVHDVPNIYHVPLLLEAQGAAAIVAKKLHLALPQAPMLDPWRSIAGAVDAAVDEVRIALVGKYTGLQDSYLSVIKSLQHAAIAAGRRLLVDWVDATALEAGTEKSDPEAFAHSWETVRAATGVLVPGGFGDRGVEGKIAAVKYAREAKVPFFGICLGLQCAVIEYSRSVLGWHGANSAEFDPKSPHPVVIFMPEINPSQMGGTMRLGSRATLLRSKGSAAPAPLSSSMSALSMLPHNNTVALGGAATPSPSSLPAAGPAAVASAATPSSPYTLAQDLYGREVKSVWERHRHRYEVNPDAVSALQDAGLFFAGTDDRSQRMEIVELDRSVHPFFFACQYHPEFQTLPHRPSPPFHGFVLAASGQLEARLPLLSSASAGSRRRQYGGGGGGGGGGSLHSSSSTSPLRSPTMTGSAGGGGGASAPAGMGGGASSGGANTALDAAVVTVTEAAASVGGRPPLAPGGAATAAGGGASAAAAAPIGAASIYASPSRPVRAQGVGTVPTLGAVPDIAPGETSRNAGGALSGGAGSGAPAREAEAFPRVPRTVLPPTEGQ